MSPWFTFWPQVVATLIGVALGVPIALGLAKWGRRLAGKAERQRLDRALKVVTEALDENREPVETLISNLKSGSIPTHLPLSIAAWETARSEVSSGLNDAELLAHLARHFERASYLVALHGRYLELIVGPAAAMTNVEDAEAVFAHTLRGAATRFLGEVEGLKERVGQHMTSDRADN